MFNVRGNACPLVPQDFSSSSRMWFTLPPVLLLNFPAQLAAVMAQQGTGFARV